MAQAFSRSLRSLDTEPVWMQRLALGLLALFGVLWCSWFFGVPVQVVVRAERARVEATEVSHPVQTPVTGSVLRTMFELGGPVQRGDVLVELDTTQGSDELSKRHAEEHALALERAALDRQIRAVERACDAERHATTLHLEEADVLESEARGLASLGAQARQRKEWLGEQGVLSKLDVLKGVTEGEERDSRVLELAAANRRVRADRDVSLAERLQLLAGLERQRSALDGNQATTVAAIQVLERELERRRIRAPISGQLSDVLALTTGSVVQAGDTLATVVPRGSLRIVAEFPHASALGRIRPGQAAQMRLDAFPWTAYGEVPANVSRVAPEIRAGMLRVELAILGETPGRVALEHGLSGSVRVEVERTSPAVLLWRAAGRGLSVQQVQP